MSYLSQRHDDPLAGVEKVYYTLIKLSAEFLGQSMLPLDDVAT